jgi:PAS domain S-box-containing protein
VRYKSKSDSGESRVHAAPEPSTSAPVPEPSVSPKPRAAPAHDLRTEAVYRTLVETSPDAILLVDVMGDVILCSGQVLRMYGAERKEQIEGHGVLEFVAPRDRERARTNLQRVVDLGSLLDVDYTLTRSDGTHFPAEVSGSAIAGAAGKPEALILVVRDVTDRHRTQDEQARLHAALRQSALEWRRTFDAIESPVLMLDFDSNVVRVNEATRALVGRSFQEIVHWPLSVIGTSQPWRAVGELHARVARERGPAACQVQDPESGRTWDLTGSVTGGEEGLPARIIIVVRDFTAMVALQASLRRNETMSVLGSLVAGVAHEVRNPLHVITATLDAFEARFGARDEFSRYLRTMRGELQRLTRLMQELLAYGRPSTPERAPVALASVAAEALRACAALARRHRIRLVNLVDQNLPPAPMDRARMIDALRNLVENALQHSHAGGSVTVGARHVVEAEHAWIECIVEDQGRGFDPDDLSHVFQPFFTRRRGGTGLGLSIVQRVVEQHGGSARAQNRRGGGACVTLTLPLV